MGRFVRTTLGARVIATKRRLSEREQIRETAGISTSPPKLLLTNGGRDFVRKCLAPQTWGVRGDSQETPDGTRCHRQRSSKIRISL